MLQNIMNFWPHVSVEDYFSKGSKVYTWFVDFQKAPDFVLHKTIFMVYFIIQLTVCTSNPLYVLR